MKVLRLDAEKYLLDKKDKKILLVLLKNAREHYSSIAKKVRLSHDSVTYRIKNMEKKGVISGYRAVVNTTFFDLYPYHVFVRLPPRFHNELIKRCIASSSVRSIIKVYGAYDFQISLLGKNSKDMDDILEDIFLDMHDVKIELLITADYIIRRGSNPYFEEPLVKNIDYKLDRIDYGIISELAENPRLPMLVVSKKLGVSVDTAIKHMKNLEKLQIISAYIPIVNEHVLGNSVFIVVAFIDDLKNQIGKINEFAKQHESLFWAARTVGRFNLIMYFSVKDSLEFHKDFTEFRNILGERVGLYELLTGYEQYKMTYFNKNMLQGGKHFGIKK
ncbi:MAG: Lrp/AsnC family transcriptional regulator [Candidatus Nanoarchaeia archaeon]